MKQNMSHFFPLLALFQRSSIMIFVHQRAFHVKTRVINWSLLFLFFPERNIYINWYNQYMHCRSLQMVFKVFFHLFCFVFLPTFSWRCRCGLVELDFSCTAGPGHLATPVPNRQVVVARQTLFMSHLPQKTTVAAHLQQQNKWLRQKLKNK